MKVFFKVTALIFLALSVVSCEKEDVDPFEFVDGTRYQITFTADWSKANFPENYPGNAHFSKLTGWSHASNSTFFQTGTIASNGIKSMAETGGTDPLESEFRTLIENGEGLDAFVGANLASGIGEITVDIAVDKEHSSVTLATMIAPSPDWYIAVVNVNLLEDGKFVEEKTIEAHVYDAGTDSGTNYTSANAETDPKEPILVIIDAPFGNGTNLYTPIATVTFKQIQ